jgi:hypothetical protein
MGQNLLSISDLLCLGIVRARGKVEAEREALYSAQGRGSVAILPRIVAILARIVATLARIGSLLARIGPRPPGLAKTTARIARLLARIVAT